mmetsp:Transcript_67850/g.201937  ORF Transcript_67850/g.201937 Transcript_67850/m.201937 type:complete len:284 (-) Transcript_67850:51-902(-)
MVSHVVVSTLAGDSLQLELQPQSTIWQLKQAVAGSAWALPPACQLLVRLDAQEPVDDADLVAQDHYTLVVSLDAVCSDLVAADPLQRRAALQALGKLGSKGGEAALAAVLPCLEDSAFEVRWAAVLAIPHIAAKGDSRALSAVAARLEDHAPCVREAAVQTAAQIAERGDRRAIAAVAVRLEHRDHEVRQAAVEAIAHVSERGDQHCITRLMALLDSEDNNVAMAAIEAIAKVAERGNRQAIAGISEYLENTGGVGGTKATHRLVRFKAKRAFAELSRESPPA